VAEDGTVQALPGLRLPWEYCITKKPCGEAVELEISRDGHLHTASVELVPEPRLVPYHDHVDASPSYVIVGGLVFLELSLPLVDQGLFETLSEPMSTGAILSKIGARRQVQDEAVILLASILESELTISYEAACIGRQLTKFNGDAAPARNLQALAAAVHSAGSKAFLKFEFGEWCAVLETAQSKKAEVDVLRAHDVASWCSPDVDPRGANVMMSCITAFSFFSARGMA